MQHVRTRKSSIINSINDTDSKSEVETDLDGVVQVKRSKTGDIEVVTSEDTGDRFIGVSAGTGTASKGTRCET